MYICANAYIKYNACAQTVSAAELYQRGTSFKKLTHMIRFLELVETRLANLENDVRLLKRQNKGQSTYEQDDDENDDISSKSTPSDVVAHGELDETHASPDATDGIGSIEFTDESDSAYFGEQQTLNPTIYDCILLIMN